MFHKNLKKQIKSEFTTLVWFFPILISHLSEIFGLKPSKICTSKTTIHFTQFSNIFCIEILNSNHKSNTYNVSLTCMQSNDRRWGFNILMEFLYLFSVCFLGVLDGRKQVKITFKKHKKFQTIYDWDLNFSKTSSPFSPHDSLFELNFPYLNFSIYFFVKKVDTFIFICFL